MSNIEMDAISIKVLKEAAKAPLSQSKYDTLIGYTDKSQPNDVDAFLRAEKLIDRRLVYGIRDAEGGYSVAIYEYSISRRGKAVLAQLRKEAGMNLAQVLANLFPF